MIILVGIVALGTNLHWWTGVNWIDLLYLWPLLLVVIGTRLIFGDKPVSVFVLFLVFLLGLLYITNFQGLRERFLPRSEPMTSTQYLNEPIEKISTAKMTFNLGAAKISTEELPPYTDHLYELNYQLLMPIDVEKNISETSGEYTFSEKNTRFGNFRSQDNRVFDLLLAPDVAYEIIMNAGACKIDLDYSKLKVDKITLSTGATDGTIRFGSLSDDVNVAIKTGASNFTLEIPKETALSIHSSSALSDNNFDSLGLEKKENEYKSSGFDQATKKLTLDFSSGVSKITINRY
jgi:hypothetical protein